MTPDGLQWVGEILAPEQDLSLSDAEGRGREAEPRIQEKIKDPEGPCLPRTPSVDHHCVCLCLNFLGTSPHVAQRGRGNSMYPENLPITCLTSETSRLNTLTMISTGHTTPVALL